MSAPKQETLQIDPNAILISNKHTKGFYNLRQTFHKESMQSLQNSIASLGLEAPLLVREIKHEQYQYELLAGERRLRTILKLKEENRSECLDLNTGEYHEAQITYKTVEAKILFNCDDFWALKYSVAENLQREKVSQLDLMEFCVDLSNRKNEFKQPMYSTKQICEIMDKSETWVSQTKSLMRLPSAVKDLIQEGKIGRTAALYFLRVEEGQISNVIAEIQKQHDIAGSFTKEEADEMYHKNKKSYELATAFEAIPIGDPKDKSKKRQMAKEKLLNSKKRHLKQAGSKQPAPVMTEDMLQETSVKMGAVKSSSKNNPITIKIVKQKLKMVDAAILNAIEDTVKINDKEFAINDIQLFQHICQYLVGKTGTFEPDEILEEYYKETPK